MSKISKTARASMGGGQVEAKKVIPDAELIRLLRIDRNSGIYPGTQGTDALLRAYDEAMVKGQQNYDSAKLLDEVANSLRAELYAANQEIEKIKASNAAVGVGAQVFPDATEPGLQPATQGLDSVEATTLPEGAAQAV
jgi:hypothetical protein